MTFLMKLLMEEDIPTTLKNGYAYNGIIQDFRLTIKVLWMISNIGRQHILVFCRYRISPVLNIFIKQNLWLKTTMTN